MISGDDSKVPEALMSLCFPNQNNWDLFSSFLLSTLESEVPNQSVALRTVFILTVSL